MSAFGVVGENGHCWVTLGVLHQEKTGWCFMPMNASIFVREKHTDAFKTKHDLALELLEQLSYSKDALLVGDNFYGTQNFVNELKCPVLSLLKSTPVCCRPLIAPMDKTYRGRPEHYGEKVHLAFVTYALLKFLTVKAIVKPLQTPWYKPKGRASLKRVQQWMRDVFQGNGIFKGVSPNCFPSIKSHKPRFHYFTGGLKF